MASLSRAAALSAIERCRRNGAWSGASIDGAIKKYGLDKRDTALASRLCLGVLQNSSLCDYYIGLFCSTPVNKLEPKVLDIMRLGAYQLIMTDKIPANAAVNECVELCKQSGFARAAGLVNAVLRKLASVSDKLPEIPESGTAKYLSIKYSHPEWLADKLIREKDFDFADAFLKANNEPAGTCVQINTLKVSAADFKQKLAQSNIAYSEPYGREDCIVFDGGSIPDMPGFEQGYFFVQDAAANLCASISEVSAGMRVLDCCSAPGGKSFAAAIAMRGEGEIISCDIHEKKLGLISSGAERLGISIISTREMDARSFEPAFENLFDLVIADVPCSGIGVIRKKPEIRQKTAKELAGLPAIQRDILNNVSRYVKKGGTLLYSTCTVLREENEEIIKAFIKEHGNFSRVDFETGSVKSENGCYTFWPNIDGTDGFFAAKLRRDK